MSSEIREIKFKSMIKHELTLIHDFNAMYRLQVKWLQKNFLTHV